MHFFKTVSLFSGLLSNKIRDCRFRNGEMTQKAAKLPTEPGILKGVHNLRHTFGRRLRSAGVPLETRKTLLGHANGDITTHYSAAELSELINAAESIVSRGRVETPNLMLIRRCEEKTVGKVSENKKGSVEKARLNLCELLDP